MILQGRTAIVTGAGSGIGRAGSEAMAREGAHVVVTDRDLDAARRTVERIVEVGETRGDVVEIRRGVAPGEAVVLAPGAEATDGMKVALVTQP